jgi:diguanylate cyclase (GGDEF)-like protein
MMWTWTLLLVALVAETSWRASVLDSAVVLAYAAIALTIIAPISLSWTTGITGAVLGIIPIVIAGAEVSSVDTVSWTIAAGTAALSSLVLLQLRLAGITSLATQQLRAQSLASTDPLTRVFSRTGILALAPAVAQTAESASTDVGVVVCTVADLDTINADYGFEYGGQVLGATARALRACVPGGTLVGRWGGHTFIALVGGEAPSADGLREAVDQALVRSGVALGKRPVSVDVGCASGSPAEITLEELVARATASASA